MTPSPLQLERHFFSKVQIDAGPANKPGVANALLCELEIGQAVEDPKRFQVVLRLKLHSPPDNTASYTGEIHAVGLFKVVDGWPDNRIGELVEANGAAFLYGCIREMVLNVTSRGPWPAVTLGAVTFVQPKTKPASTASVSLLPQEAVKS
ncbi:MAG: protein-export chaperone SecB [Verrucomicrobia bacterium]|nr:protein-export chaperone SecB [Verrucomicrobiota bacterium]